MAKKLPLLALSAVAGLAVVITSLRAADAPAAPTAPTAPTAPSTPAAPSAPTVPSAPSSPGNVSPAPATPNSTTPDPTKPDLSKLPAASDKKGLTFDKDILPILKASCSGCHIGSANPRSGLNLGTLPTALKGGTKTKDKDIVAGHGDQSFVLLYAADLVKGKEMPPLSGRTAHPAIKKEDLALIRAWIDQGAK